MLAPVGVLSITDKNIPIEKFITDKTAEDIITVLKVRNILIVVSAGKIINADISMAPIIFIPITMTIADKRAIVML